MNWQKGSKHPCAAGAIAAVVLLVWAGAAFGLGSGSVVEDPWNLLENTGTAGATARQLTMQLEQYRTQLMQYEAQYQNLQDTVNGRFGLNNLQSQIGQTTSEIQALESLDSGLGDSYSAVDNQYQSYMASNLTPQQYVAAQESMAQTGSNAEATQFEAARQTLGVTLPNEWANVQALEPQIAKVKGTQSNLHLLNNQMANVSRENMALLQLSATKNAVAAQQAQAKDARTLRLKKDQNTMEQNVNASNQSGQKAAEQMQREWMPQQ
ncbi:MAG: TrbJ/VirB5 family protein [Acidiferrobacterales bacterium]